MKPRMFMVAGPPRSGKSTFFPVSTFGVEFFNADDRAAQLNGGSYQAIPITIRAQVNAEFEWFVEQHIRAHKSFAIETTLLSSITFEQTERARAEGFFVSMDYIALDAVMSAKTSSGLRFRLKPADTQHRTASFEPHIRLVWRICPTRSESWAALPCMSSYGARPTLIMETFEGRVVFLAEDIPSRLENALGGTEFAGG